MKVPPYSWNLIIRIECSEFIECRRCKVEKSRDENSSCLIERGKSGRDVGLKRKENEGEGGNGLTISPLAA